MSHQHHPTEDELVTILNDFRPVPSSSFHQKMTKTPWMPQSIAFKSGYLTAFVAVLALILIGGLLLSRTWDDNANPAFSAFPSATAVPTATYDPSVLDEDNLYPLTINEASQIAGFEAIIPQLLPDDLRFEGARANGGILILHFISADTYPHADYFDLVQWNPTVAVDSLWLDFGFEGDITVRPVHERDLTNMPDGENLPDSNPEIEIPTDFSTQLYLWWGRGGQAIKWRDGDINIITPPVTHNLSQAQLIDIGECMLISHHIFEPDFFLGGLRRHFDSKDIACYPNGDTIQKFIGDERILQLHQRPLAYRPQTNVIVDSSEVLTTETLGDVTLIQGEQSTGIPSAQLELDIDLNAVGLVWQTDEFQFELWSVGGNDAEPIISVDQLLEIAASLE